jgi:hypothetical protein
MVKGKWKIEFEPQAKRQKKFIHRDGQDLKLENGYWKMEILRGREMDSGN